MSVSSSTVMSCMPCRPPRRLAWLVCVAALLTGVIAAGTSDAFAARRIEGNSTHSLAPRRALAAQPPQKQLLGEVPHRTGGPSGPFATPSLGGPAYDFPPQPGAMAYHSGRVLHTTTVRTVYWVPSGYSVSANYRTLIDGFVGDVAAESGKTSNVFASDTQYTDSTLGHIQYSMSFAGGVVDTNPFPASVSSYRYGECDTGGICITDTQLEHELENVIAAHGWPVGGFSNGYVILTPQNVNICVDWAVDPY